MSIEIVNFTDRTPSDRNIEEMVTLTAEDLLRGGSPKKYITEYADVSNPTHIAKQRERVSTNPEAYSGAFNAEALEAFVKIDKWLRGEQGNFESIFQRIKDRQNGPHLPGEPLGILALSIAKDILGERKEEIGNGLLDLSLRGKESSEIRIGLPENDPLKDVVIGHRFEPTGMTGKVLGVKQELYIRPPEPPKAHSEQGR